ncbi:alpha/beta fold hydrolase [Rhodococcus sp. BS-15]|uniref:alpha/beta fold hydrolase n=1 Tax=Rhodococcus sp. BS-15 TaxID=1304954 RepID=UPI000A5853D3|nr:alpha/beta hydrolase [Rhodococcus sp. BS-15]
MMIRAGVLDVAFDRFGDPSGRSVVLLHGFPYDPRGYDDVARLLAESGYDVVVPYLRGFGPTQFVDTDTMRSGEQAAIGHDLRELIIALELNEPIVAGYDWGGRAACVVAAMWPELISGLVSVSGYLIQDIAAAVSTPVLPHLEKRYWYQYYLHSERAGPGSRPTARSSHRHCGRIGRRPGGTATPNSRLRHPRSTTPTSLTCPCIPTGTATESSRGDAAYAATQELLTRQPRITVPTVVIDPTEDTVASLYGRPDHAAHFTDLIDVGQIDCGHNPPQELPGQFADAVVTLGEAVRDRDSN